MNNPDPALVETAPPWSLARTTAYVAAIFAVVLTLYSPVVRYPFQFDDRASVRDEERIRDIRDIGAIWRINPPRFTVFLSFAANYAIGGVDTLGYHLFNILVHASVSAALWYLLTLMFQATGRLEGWGGAGRLERSCALAAAMIYAVHPLQTGAVTFIWQRSASMAALFYMMTLIFYLKSALAEQAGRPRREWLGWLALSLSSCLLAMFTKQFSVTIPLAVALMEALIVSGSYQRMEKRAARLAPFAPMLLVTPVVILLAGAREISDLAMRKDNLLPTHQYLFTQFNVIAFVYLKLFFYPAGQSLDYDFPPARNFMDSAGGFLILAAVLSAGLALRKQNRMAAFGILFFFLAISVESSVLVLEDTVFEHRMYLPMAGLLAALASLLRDGLRRRPERFGPALALAAAFAACVPLAWATAARNQVWSSEETLWKDVISKHPDKIRGWANIALLYRNQRRYAELEPVLEKCVSIKPGWAYLSHDLGVVKRLNGNLKDAEKYLKIAASIEPQPATYMELGRVHEAQGRLNDAGEDYIRAVNSAPGFLEPYLMLASLLVKTGDLAGAEKAAATALKIHPADARLLEKLDQIRRAREGNK